VLGHRQQKPPRKMAARPIVSMRCPKTHSTCISNPSGNLSGSAPGHEGWTAIRKKCWWQCFLPPHLQFSPSTWALLATKPSFGEIAWLTKGTNSVLIRCGTLCIDQNPIFSEHVPFVTFASGTPQTTSAQSRRSRPFPLSCRSLISSSQKNRTENC